mgnify:CR=1 FL=1
MEIIGSVVGIGRYELLAMRLVWFGAFGVILFWHSFPRMSRLTFIHVVTLIVPLLAFLFVILGIVNIHLADKLAMEDGVIEWLSALFLFIGSAAMVVVSTLAYRRKQVHVACVAVLCAIAFFIIGMEEVSWM